MPDYLREAVAARIATAAGRSMEDLTAVTATILPESFLDEAGEIDTAKVEEYAQHFKHAPAPAFDPDAERARRMAEDPVAQAIARQNTERAAEGLPPAEHVPAEPARRTGTFASDPSGAAASSHLWREAGHRPEGGWKY